MNTDIHGSKRLPLFICVYLWLISTACAQVSFTLATKDGKSRFRVGEAIEVELRFQATEPGKYGVWTTSLVRQVRRPEFDHFTVEPSTGVADPLVDIFAQMSGGGGRVPRAVPLSSVPTVVGVPMNEWLSIRHPGHYRITAETTRVVSTDNPPTTVTLHSNTIEIDLVEPEPGWTESSLRQAVATLERPDPPQPKIGEEFDPRPREVHDADAAAAARVLRFLETKEAARALARFYEHGPVMAQSELRAGLFASPHRTEVIAAMEEAITAPDVPVNYSYLGALIELVNLTRYGPTPDYTPKGPDEIRKWIDEVQKPYRDKSQSTEPEYFKRLADAIGTKEGPARAISLETLINRGAQFAGPDLQKGIAENFAALPEVSQQSLLTSGWVNISSPAMEPVVRSIAGGNSPLRDSALVRLWEFDPGAARAVTLDRIRRADIAPGPYNDYRILLSLPEATLPEMDDPLVTALEQGKPRVDVLIARYASDGARGSLRTWAEHFPSGICGGVLPAYFFRVDPIWAASEVIRLRSVRPGSCFINLGPNEDLLMSPGLERQAIEDLENPDEMIRRSALTMLQNGASAAAEKPLLDAFVRRQDEHLDDFFVRALLSGVGWVASKETADRARVACVTDSCRKQVDSARQVLQPPIKVALDPVLSGYAMVGAVIVRGPKQFESKIAQFPKGTVFDLGPKNPDNAYRKARLDEARKIVEGAGMKLSTDEHR
jgi:hypothetical protein